MLRRIRHFLHFLIIRAIFALLRLIPLDAASATGGWLGRTIGPRLPLSGRAEKNLRLAFPGMPEAERRRILLAMWDNLGRMAAEFPHLNTKKMSSRIHVEGTELVDALIAGGKASIFISGHFANWEIVPKAAADYGIPLQLVYRPANNLFVDALIQNMRGRIHGGLMAKGRRTGLNILRELKEGQHIGILVDQKMNSGLPIPFFGHEAMTNTAVMPFALKRGVPVIPVWAERTGGCRFTVHVYPPLVFSQSGDHEKDIRDGMTQINALLESWIRRDPAQWFWLHRRWGKL